MIRYRLGTLTAAEMEQVVRIRIKTRERGRVGMGWRVEMGSLTVLEF